MFNDIWLLNSNNWEWIKMELKYSPISISVCSIIL